MSSIFTKQETKQRLAVMRAELGDDYRASLNVALFISSNALINRKLHSGQDYALHYMHVGLTDTRDDDARAVGILHDVVEDSDWTVKDLKEVGFSDKIVDAVDAMSLRDGEEYFDMIKRCGSNKLALDRKLVDLRHNMDCSRNSRIMSEKTMHKIHKYMIAKEYLKSVRAGKIEPGSSVMEFVKLSDVFNCQSSEQIYWAQKIARKNSSKADNDEYLKKYPRKYKIKFGFGLQ